MAPVSAVKWILTSFNGEHHEESIGASCPRCNVSLYGVVVDRWYRGIFDLHCWKCGMLFYVDRRE
jgi:hypothetical protein